MVTVFRVEIVSIETWYFLITGFVFGNVLLELILLEDHWSLQMFIYIYIYIFCVCVWESTFVCMHVHPSIHPHTHIHIFSGLLFFPFSPFLSHSPPLSLSVYTFSWMYIYIYIYMYIFLIAWVEFNGCENAFNSTHRYVLISMCICLCLSVCLCVCVCVCEVSSI